MVRKWNLYGCWSHPVLFAVWESPELVPQIKDCGKSSVSVFCRSFIRHRTSNCILHVTIEITIHWIWSRVGDRWYILSSATEVGSLNNRLGSGPRRDTDQGPFSPSTGGLGLTLMGASNLLSYTKAPISVRTSPPVDRLKGHWSVSCRLPARRGLRRTALAPMLIYIFTLGLYFADSRF